MADVLNKQQRSRNMSNIRGKNTKPELRLRKELWASGYRYRLSSKLPGKPDIVFPAKKLVVFVDGCFWHKCPEHFVAPKTNQDFWTNKINRNVERDIKVIKEIEQLGWVVLRFWEHEVKADLGSVVQSITRALDV